MITTETWPKPGHTERCPIRWEVRAVLQDDETWLGRAGFVVNGGTFHEVASSPGHRNSTTAWKGAGDELATQLAVGTS